MLTSVRLLSRCIENKKVAVGQSWNILQHFFLRYIINTLVPNTDIFIKMLVIIMHSYHEQRIMIVF